MTRTQVLRQLKSYGTAQNRKVYRRHGAGEDQFGVSYEALKQLTKQVRRDDALARALWATGNHDARIFSTMIADPARPDPARLEDWAQTADNYMQADALADFAARTADAKAVAERWIESEREWVGRAGWQVMARLAMKDRALPDAYFEPFVARIEAGIHQAQNKTKDAMNNALIAMGMRGAGLAANVMAAARRIGRVEVDHGETNCKTPDAVSYIQRSRARKGLPP